MLPGLKFIFMTENKSKQALKHMLMFVKAKEVMYCKTHTDITSLAFKSFDILLSNLIRLSVHIENENLQKEFNDLIDQMKIQLDALKL